MAAELPVVTVVLFIATGVLVFLLLFLFAKRQIIRFTLKSARKPHISIGADAPKEMREEIQRRLDLVQTVRFEPALLSEHVQNTATTVPNHYYCRMKALDAFTNAVDCLRAQDCTVTLRSTKQTIQLYIFSLCPSAPSSSHAKLIHQFCHAYNRARHNPAIFGDAEFVNYMELLDRVIRLIKNDQKRRESILKPTLETEVRLCKGGGDAAETVPRMPTATKHRRRFSDRPPSVTKRPEHIEQINLVDKSSGYSSTDHSSSGRGSAERLISPQLTATTRDEAV